MPENLLVTLLRRCYSISSCHQPSIRSITHKRSLHTQPRPSPDHSNKQVGNDTAYRTYATAANPSSDEIAVLGGGITGLTSAFFLSRELPDTKITLYEASDSLGGWMRSKHIDVGNGTVLFEQGPRTLRPHSPAGALTYMMVKQLGLEDEVITTSRDSISAKNRYIYYPDRLVTMPGPGHNLFRNLWTLFREPMFEGIWPAIGGEYDRPKRPEDLQDESVGSFLRRRLGSSNIGDNVVSAVLHGIYAGDIEQLSVKSLFPIAWHNEAQYGSISSALWTIMTKEGAIPKVTERDAKMLQELRNTPVNEIIPGSPQKLTIDMNGIIPGSTQNTTIDMAKVKQMQSASVYSFKKGIGSLSEALEKNLRASPNVEIKTGHEISQLEYQEGENSILIKSSDKRTPPKSFSRVISTISGRKLSSLTPSKTASTSLVPTLASTHSVTVMVVNLYFTNPKVLPAHGFGYLIPRSIPFDQNPECALGVIFDSDAMVGQDNVPGTKVTVMMGGHWWDNYLHSGSETGTGIENNSYPTEDEGAVMARAVLQRHLGIVEEPAKVLVSLQTDCIPQYTVGHTERLKQAHLDLLKSFGGRLAVAGNSYTGVGVNDCVRGARDIAVMVRNAVKFGSGLGATGLEQFSQEPKYVFPRQGVV